MSSTKIKLTSQDERSVYISSAGPEDATIKLPITSTAFEFASREEIEEQIATSITSSSTSNTSSVIISKPVIASPSNGQTLFTGNITVNRPSSLPTGLTGDTYVIFQIADSVDFNNVIVEKIKKTTSTSNWSSIQSLTSSELVNSGILGSTSTRTIKYYLRVKVVFENKTSFWSNTVMFTYGSNQYATPIINSIEMEKDPILEAKGIDRYTGGIIIKTQGYSVSRGTLPKPETVEVILSNGQYSTTIEVPYESKDIKIYPEYTNTQLSQGNPFKVLPNTQHTITIAYKAVDETNTLVMSSRSASKSITPPLPLIRLGDLQIVQNAENILTAPTVGVTAIYVDYNFVNALSNGSPFTDSNNSVKDTRYIGVDIVVKNSSGSVFVTRQTGIPIWYFHTSNITKYPYTGCLLTLNDGQFSISQTYTLEVTASLTGGTTQGIGLSPTTKTEIFQIKGNTINVPMDNLNRVISTYPASGSKQFGYFGEIVGEYNANKNYTLMPDVRFTGNFKSNKSYLRHDEVIFNNELYMCTNDIVSPTGDPSTNPQNFTKVTIDNFSTHYKSGLPSYSWLAKEIGLPIAMPFSKKTNGDVVAEDACSRVINNTEGWIKVHNYAKQILYIAKKPIASNIPYRELRRRFLTGSYTRTIRIGLNYYSVRLLETGPSDVLDEKMITSSSIPNSINLQNEKDLYSNIFRNLFTYQMEDLGLIDNDNYTYGNKSKIHTYTVLDEFGAVNVKTEESEITTDDYDDNGTIYYYRPVLELVRETNLPFRKSKVLPGSIDQGTTTGAWLNYDKWTDTGYYGTVSSNILFTPQELKSMFNISGLTNLPTDVRFHKFYWHGMVFYIPNKPIGVLPQTDINTLIENDLIYGTDKNSPTLYGESKWSMMLPNFSNKYYINYSPLEGTTTPTNNHVEYGSIIFDLIYRMLPNIQYDDRFLPILNKFTTTPNDDFDIEGFYIKDMVIGNLKAPHLADKVNTTEEAVQYIDIGRCENLVNKTIISKADFQDLSEYYKYSNFWPVVFTECADKNLDYSYGSVSTTTPIYGTTSEWIDVFDVVEKQVERERVVNKPIEKTVEVKYTVEKKIETGNYVFSNTERQISDTYGIVVFYAKKTDNCYITTPLYDKTSLNVVNFLNGLGVKFSNQFPTVDTYMLQSIMTNGTTTQNVANPIIINKFFKETREVKTYLKNLVRTGIPIGTLKNYASNIVNTSTDRLKPYGMMYGKISSSYTWFAVPDWYNLYEDPTTGTMNKDPMITVDNSGGLDNTWTSMPNINNTPLTIPLLNTYLTYEDYSITGREELIDKVIPYIINREYQNVTVDTVDSIKQEIKDTYIFGVVVVELNSLCVLPNNGILYGDILTPSFLQTSASHRMTPYFNTTNEVVDLFNPAKDYITEYVEETRYETVLVDNYVTEKYTETVYEETINRVYVTYPTIKYN